MPPIGPAALLATARDRDPARPLVTHYDDSTGERVELSATTLANWVAKTANLLQDEFDVGPGSTVAVSRCRCTGRRPRCCSAVWSCGATVVDTAAEDDGGLSGVDVVLAAQDRLAALEEEEGDAELLGLSLHPLGGGMAGYAGPARDFALEVRTHGDRFVPYEPPDPDGDRARGGGLELTLGGLVDAAGELAGRLGIGADDRILVDDAGRRRGRAGRVAAGPAGRGSLDRALPLPVRRAAARARRGRTGHRDPRAAASTASVSSGDGRGG